MCFCYASRCDIPFFHQNSPIAAILWQLSHTRVNYAVSMNRDVEISLITTYMGQYMEILLPVLDESTIAGKEPSGHCFRVHNAENAEILLSCVDSSNVRRTAVIDVSTSCKDDSAIAIYILRKPAGELFLRTYIDNSHNGLYPLPIELLGDGGNRQSQKHNG